MTETSSRRSPGTALAVLLVALVPRLYVAIAWSREPVWDGHYYDLGARSIAAGRGYVGVEGAPWCHYPVGYSTWLGFAYRLFGTGAWVGPLLNAVMGAMTAALVYLLAVRAEADPRSRRPLVAGLLVALHPGLIAYTPLLMTETTSAWLLVLAPALFLLRSSSWRWALFAGLVFGCGTLVRPQTILCAPALYFLAPVTLTRRTRVACAALATAGALLVVAPWTVRNCTVMDGCAFVSTNGGWNLAIGSFPRATGRFETLRGSDGCAVVTGQVQQDRCWSQRAAGWIAGDPVRWLGLIPRKLGFTFDHESFAVGYLGEADPARWTDGRKERARLGLSAAHCALLSVAPLAFLVRPSRRRPATLLPSLGIALLAWVGISSDEHPFWPLAILLVVVAAWSVAARAKAVKPRGPLVYAAYAVGTLVFVHAVFFGEDRYHIVVSPLLCLLTAFAWRTSAEDEGASLAAPVDPEEPPDGLEEPGSLGPARVLDVSGAGTVPPR
ncbi:MAG: glycosyltransferase family 39 protein [Deltaproteobacteria bacterium]|nr:glycosyltransferase family 39 protein [Deltaproteobacteria bacterium]